MLDLQGSLKRQDSNGSADGTVFLGHTVKARTLSQGKPSGLPEEEIAMTLCRDGAVCSTRFPPQSGQTPSWSCLTKTDNLSFQTLEKCGVRVEILSYLLPAEEHPCWRWVVSVLPSSLPGGPASSSVAQREIHGVGVL